MCHLKPQTLLIYIRNSLPLNCSSHRIKNSFSYHSQRKYLKAARGALTPLQYLTFLSLPLPLVFHLVSHCFTSSLCRPLHQPRMFVFLAAPGDRAGSMTQVADARREAGAWAGPLHLRHLGVVVRAPEARTGESDSTWPGHSGCSEPLRKNCH